MDAAEMRAEAERLAAEADRLDRERATRDEKLARVRAARERTQRAFSEMLDAAGDARAAGVTVAKICEAGGISRATFYRWVQQDDAPDNPFVIPGINGLKG